MIPYEHGSTNATHFSGELTSEGSETEFCNQDFLKRGCEFLKRTRRGNYRATAQHDMKEMDQISFFSKLIAAKLKYVINKDCSQPKTDVWIAGDLHWRLISVYINKDSQVSKEFLVD